MEKIQKLKDKLEKEKEKLKPYEESLEKSKQEFTQASKKWEEIQQKCQKLNTHKTFYPFIPNNNYSGKNPINESNINELLSLCNQATFGNLKSQTTELNTSVRKAFDCPADRFLFEDKESRRNDKSPDFLQEISKQICKTLMLASEIKLVPYKLTFNL